MVKRPLLLLILLSAGLVTFDSDDMIPIDVRPTTGASAAEDSLTVVSDTQTEWFDGNTWQPAVAAWVHPWWPTLPAAAWTWKSYKVLIFLIR